MEVTLLTRGQRNATVPEGVETITADIENVAAAEQALAGRKFDAVVDWIAYTPDQIERDIALFRGRVRQFLFISTASAYQRPSSNYLVTESTPLANFFWDYSRNKIACEERLMKPIAKRASRSPPCARHSPTARRRSRCR